MKPSWWHKAACRGLDPSIFYPASDEEAAPAKLICDECDVRQTCVYTRSAPASATASGVGRQNSTGDGSSVGAAAARNTSAATNSPPASPMGFDFRAAPPLAAQPHLCGDQLAAGSAVRLL
jgi:hypothetical protein